MKLPKSEIVLLCVLFALGCIMGACVVGCGPPQPRIEAQEVSPEQQALMDQIDEMGMAADGKEFIAAPPTCYEEMKWKVVRRKELDRFEAEMKLRQEKTE